MIKHISVEGLDKKIILARRKGTQNLKISLKSDGNVRVTVPYGVPEFVAKKFVKDRIDWIYKHQKPQITLESGNHIGKSHVLSVGYSDASRHSTKINNTEIIVRLPRGTDVYSLETQEIIKKACGKALLKEGNNLLPQRLDFLSKKHSIEYKSCSVKKLKSRWGACDNNKNITLNSYLIQLDWELIDYVICHELAHTAHQHHQLEFWNMVHELLPNYKDLRKALKSKPTSIMPT